MKLIIAMLAFLLAASPAIAVDQVKGTTAAPAGQAAQTATTTNNAVVSKGISTASVTVPPSTEAQTYEIPIKDFMDAATPYILAGIASLIPIIFAWVRSVLKTRLNVEVDDRLANQFQTGAINAAGLLVAKGLAKIEEGGKVQVHNKVLADAATDLMLRFPDAMKRFDITPERVQDVILGKIPQVVPVPPPLPPDVAGRPA